MKLRDRATILHYHRHRVDTFGAGSAGALGWRAAESQRLRFDAIASFLELDGRAVLDVGCGYGDLRAHLDERFEDFSYIGLEQVPEFVEAARERYGALAKTWFHECDASGLELPGVHYVVASGTLNYRCEEADYHLGLIRRMYDAAEVALVFNVLVAGRFPEHPVLRGVDTDEVTALCRELSPLVDVQDGYLRDDVTIRVRRP